MRNNYSNQFSAHLNFWKERFHPNGVSAKYGLFQDGNERDPFLPAYDNIKDVLSAEQQTKFQASFVDEMDKAAGRYGRNVANYSEIYKQIREQVINPTLIAKHKSILFYIGML